VSALNCFKAFENSEKTPHPWPLSKESVLKFTTWAISVNKLKATTVSSYLGSIAYLHKLNDIDDSNCHCFMVKSLLRGAENLNFYEPKSRVSRKVMTFPLLKLLAHQISKADWLQDSKQVMWTAATTAFYGSFRFGELLSLREKSYNRAETLLWSDLTFKKDSVVVRVKVPKSRNPDGEYVDLFMLEDGSYCPVKALAKLKNLKGEGYRVSDPVFMFESGKLLTPSTLNSTLHTLLYPHIGKSAEQITGHSFRAALPSALANRPDLANDEDIKLWGRWDSSSFKKYTRLKPDQKRAVFHKIVSSLGNF
jgi:hypothetical protein